MFCIKKLLWILKPVKPGPELFQKAKFPLSDGQTQGGLVEMEGQPLHPRARAVPGASPRDERLRGRSHASTALRTHRWVPAGHSLVRRRLGSARVILAHE